MKDSQKAVREMLEIVTELAEIVRDLDPGRTVTYARLEDRFEKVRGHLAMAKTLEA